MHEPAADRAESPPDAEKLLARSAKLKLYVMLRRTIDAARLPEMLGEHLRWLIDREQEGRVFLSGPMAPHGIPGAPNSMILIRADSLADAEALASRDPFVLEGILTFDLCEWTVNEGAIQVTLTLSDSTARFAPPPPADGGVAAPASLL